MDSPRHPVPVWVARGKTIRQLIKELETFEDQDMEVRISFDDGNTCHVISIVEKQENCCVLANCEKYYNTGWQDFMDQNKPKA